MAVPKVDRRQPNRQSEREANLAETKRRVGEAARGTPFPVLPTGALDVGPAAVLR